MHRRIYLLRFTEEELIFNDEETLSILEFFFPGATAKMRNQKINHIYRELAQGLLVEAVDASFAMGFVEAVFRGSSNPRDGGKEIMKKFAKEARKHWFKHSTAKNLTDIKIYDLVRNKLRDAFKTHFDAIIMLDGQDPNHGRISAFIPISLPGYTRIIWWG